MKRRVLMIMGLAMAVGGSAASCATAAHRDAADVLGLRNPVSVVSVGSCPDGGSIKGTLVDPNGKQYHFFIDRRLQTRTYGRWYVGPEIDTGKAELLAEADGRIGAIHAILIAWLERMTTLEERSRLAHLDQAPRPDRSRSVEASLTDHATWFVARHFMKAKE